MPDTENVHARTAEQESVQRELRTVESVKVREGAGATRSFDIRDNKVGLSKRLSCANGPLFLHVC